MKEELPEVYFGKVEKDIDWKKYTNDSDNEDPKETPKEVIGILGFDPDELFEE